MQSVTVASVSQSNIVTCSRGVKLCADKHISECTKSSWDLIVCPGGNDITLLQILYTK